MGGRFFKGESHTAGRAAAQKAGLLAEAIEADANDANHKFRNEATGEILTREQAAQLFNQATGKKLTALSSEDLKAAGMLGHVGEAGELAGKPLPATWRVTVQVVPDPESPGGVFRSIQIDQIEDGKNVRSYGPETAKAAGFDVPDFSKLPQGQYTVEQALKFKPREYPVETIEQMVKGEKQTFTVQYDYPKRKFVLRDSTGDVLNSFRNVDEAKAWLEHWATYEPTAEPKPQYGEPGFEAEPPEPEFLGKPESWWTESNLRYLKRTNLPEFNRKMASLGMKGKPVSEAVALAQRRIAEKGGKAPAEVPAVTGNWQESAATGEERGKVHTLFDAAGKKLGRLVRFKGRTEWFVQDANGEEFVEPTGLVVTFNKLDEAKAWLENKVKGEAPAPPAPAAPAPAPMPPAPAAPPAAPAPEAALMIRQLAELNDKLAKGKATMSFPEKHTLGIEITRLRHRLRQLGIDPDAPPPEEPPAGVPVEPPPKGPAPAAPGVPYAPEVAEPVAEGLTLSEIRRRLPVGFDPTSVRIENGKIIAQERTEYGGRWMEVSLKKATSKPIEPPVNLGSAVPQPEEVIPTEHRVAGETPQAIPAEQIGLRPDLMQFKRADDARTGINETDRLEGEWDPLKAGLLLLWEPENPAKWGLKPGQKYMLANGHHRFEFGQRKGVSTFNSQIVREADGISVGDARALAAEINIADGKGTIHDQVKFIRNTASTLGPDEAVAEARRIGAKGRKAANIAVNAGPSLFDSFINEKIDPDAAEQLALAAPGNDAAQRLGINLMKKKGLTPQAARGAVKGALLGFAESGRMKQADFFADTSLEEAWAEVGRKVAEQQKGLEEQIRSVQGAARRPDLAAKLGVDVNDPQGVNKRIQELKAELERWETWDEQPDLAAKILRPPPEEPPPGVTVKRPPKKPSPAGGELLPPGEIPFNLTGKQGKVVGAAVKPREAEAGFGEQRLAQQEMFALQQVVESKDPFKSADAAQQMYGGPKEAIGKIEGQLRVIDSDKAYKKAFVKEQRSRLAEVLNVLRERWAKMKKDADDTLRDWKDGGGPQGLLSGPMDPKVFDALIVKGVALLEKGIVNAGEWTAAMVREYGHQIRPYLADVRRRAEQMRTAAFRKAGPQPAAGVAGAAGVPPSAPPGAPPAGGPPGPTPPGAPAPGAPAPAPYISPAAKGATSFLGKVRNTFQTGLKSWPIRRLITYQRDVVDTAANHVAEIVKNDLVGPLRRAMGKKKYDPLDDEALGRIIESGNDFGALQRQRGIIQGSPVKPAPYLAEKWEQLRQAVGRPARPVTWRDKMLAAIDHAERNWARLKPVADQARTILDREITEENKNGVPTEYLNNYLPHVQEMPNEFGFFETGGGEGVSTGFRHIRTHETLAHSVAAGIDPRTIRATDLIHGRIAAGQRAINNRLWLREMQGIKDPQTGNPIMRDPVEEKRPDGTVDFRAPQGYGVEMTAVGPVAILNGYKGLFDALNNPSYMSRNLAAQTARGITQSGKSIALMIDTFHLARMAFWETVIKPLGVKNFRFPVPSYKKGLLSLDFSPEELYRMADAGELTTLWGQKQLTRADVPAILARKAKLEEMIKAGYNIGRLSDVMHQHLLQKLPIYRETAGRFNKFVFEDFVRGAMAEVGELEYDRYHRMYANLPPAEVTRMAARDLNTRFGALGRQGIFRSKSMQDNARLVALAPQWNEALIRSELAAVKGFATGIKGSIKNRRLQFGVLPRAVGAMMLGQLAANQIINYITRGHSTFENEEEGFGAKISAHIPDLAGGPGFFLHPFGLAAEISHLLTSKYEKTEDLQKTLQSFLGSRASTTARPLMVLFSGRDPMGRLLRPEEKLKAAGAAAIPLPIPAPAVTGLARTGAARAMGSQESYETFPGQFQRQAMASVGVKTDIVPSPVQRMYALAHKFNKERGVEEHAEFYRVDYADLTRALTLNNMSEARASLKELLSKKTRAQVIEHYLRWPVSPFTANSTREFQFRATLTPAQRDAYRQAIQERRAVQQKFFNLLNTVGR